MFSSCYYFAGHHYGIIYVGLVFLFTCSILSFLTYSQVKKPITKPGLETKQGSIPLIVTIPPSTKSSLL